MQLDELEAFIVEAKAKTYVGQGISAAASRAGAYDLTYERDEWSYRDSYFGGTDFLGQEVVWYQSNPAWAMNYYGYILRPELINAERAGTTIKAALCEMYGLGRFLDGFEWVGEFGDYRDKSTGDVTHFSGRETIQVSGIEAYALDYHGGLVKP